MWLISSLRPSKSIQRQIVFDGIQTLISQLDLDQAVYVGFGSIWFTDFVLAHEQLGINEMYSIERDEITFRRAVFNAPFATVEVCRGDAASVLRSLVKKRSIQGRPWVTWLDYDSPIDKGMCDDIGLMLGYGPIDSLLLITFNGNAHKYGIPKNRPELLKDIFGDVVPDDLSRDDCRDPLLQDELADSCNQFHAINDIGSRP